MGLVSLGMRIGWCSLGCSSRTGRQGLMEGSLMVKDMLLTYPNSSYFYTILLTFIKILPTTLAGTSQRTSILASYWGSSRACMMQFTNKVVSSLSNAIASYMILTSVWDVLGQGFLLGRLVYWGRFHGWVLLTLTCCCCFFGRGYRL